LIRTQTSTHDCVLGYWRPSLLDSIPSLLIALAAGRNPGLKRETWATRHPWGWRIYLRSEGRRFDRLAGMMTPDLRYPIGYPRKGTSFTAEERAAAVEGIALLPQALRVAVKDFSEERLETPYRPEGWTVRQLIHHVADSHMNAYIRVRLGLTQEWPTISPYDENRWAALADARSAAIGPSLDLLEALHSRWVQLFRSLGNTDWQRGYTHPENGRQSVEQALMLYDWHGRHHTAHITQLSTRTGW
jgi:hypothetical protein